MIRLLAVALLASCASLDCQPRAHLLNVECDPVSHALCGTRPEGLYVGAQCRY